MVPVCKSNWFWKGCKPNSVCPDFSGERIICLGSRYPESVRFRGTGAGRSGIPYLALHPMGFSVPRRLRFARCALTAPFHPCRRLLRNAGGLIFCGTVRRKAFQLSARVYPLKFQISNLKSQKLRGIAPFGVRTFLFRLAPKAILRPSKTKNNIPKKKKLTRSQGCRFVECHLKSPPAPPRFTS